MVAGAAVGALELVALHAAGEAAVAAAPGVLVAGGRRRRRTPTMMSRMTSKTPLTMAPWMTMTVMAMTAVMVRR